MPRQQDTRERNNPMVYQELQFLRNRVKQLEGKAITAPSSTLGETKTEVSYKIDPRVFPALRQLLVACENHFGPEPGEKAAKLPKELVAAMKAAEQLVRPPAATVKA